MVVSVCILVIFFFPLSETFLELFSSCLPHFSSVSLCLLCLSVSWRLLELCSSPEVHVRRRLLSPCWRYDPRPVPENEANFRTVPRQGLNQILSN